MRKQILSQSTPTAAEKNLYEQNAPLGYLLRKANNAHRTLVEKELADFKLTLPQFSVLKFLSRYPGISNADLARLSLLTPQTVCVIVKNLEKMGALQKAPHSIHGRIQHITLTPKGKNLLEQSLVRVDQIQEMLGGAIPAKELATIKQWLIHVAKLVE